MARTPRLEYAGAYHHVMNRGAGHRDVFVDDRDRRRFLQLLAQAHDRFELEAHAYCLMGNHFHLLTRTPRANLGEAMHHITSCYASWFNDRSGTDGSLFRGRYLAKHVDADNYLLQVSRYIHLNPVEANLVARGHEYQWSSMASYLGLSPTPPWLYTDQTLTMLGGSTPRAAYATFVGDGQHIEEAAWYLDNTADTANEPPSNRATGTPILDEVDKAVARTFGADLASLTVGRRGQKNMPRAIAASICRDLTGLPFRDLAVRYGFGGPTSAESAVARLRTLAADDSEIAASIAAITANIVEVADHLVPGTTGSATR